MDLYRFDPLKNKLHVPKWIERFGTGPFFVLREYQHKGEQNFCMQSLQDGRIHIKWGPPANWGVLDPFLTAAHNAVEQKDAEKS